MIKLQKKRINWKADLLIDMTPMLDAVFILLIFFVITANVTQHVFPVKLPESDPSFKSAPKNEEPLKITLFADGSYAIDEKKYHSINQVKSQIKALAVNRKKVVIIPDSNSKSGNLISFLTFLEGNNIKNVDILVKDGK